jgi:hypothetical protein
VPTEATGSVSPRQTQGILAAVGLIIAAMLLSREPGPVLDPAQPAPALSRNVPAPATRPFLMGFTRWPSDLTIEGFLTAQDFAHAHGDIVSVMFIYVQATRGVHPFDPENPPCQ